MARAFCNTFHDMSAVTRQPSFSAHPLVALAAAVAFGVLLAQYSAAPLALSLACGACLSTSAAVAFIRKKTCATSYLLFFSFVCTGASLASIEVGRVSETRLRRLYERGQLASGEPLELDGVLERAPEVAPDGLLFSLRVERLRRGREERAASGRVEFFAPVRDERAGREYESLELRRGARVRVLSEPTRAERYRNPGVESLNDYLEQRDADARATIKSPLLVERLDDESVLLPLVWLDDWRRSLVVIFDRMFSADTSGVLKASLLGNRQGLSRANAERFREGGTFHVLVISGLHITLLGGLVWAAARRVTRRPVCQWALSVGCVWVYTIGVGAESSVVRAALMFSAAALAPALGRRAGALNALGGAALVLLVWRPRNLFDPSFQLTFLSVLAIVSLALPLLTHLREVGEWRPVRATPRPPECARSWLTLGELLFWSERRQRRELESSTHTYRLFKTPWAARLERWHVQRPLRYFFAALLVSLAVQLVLLPVQVLYFHRLSLASLVLNVFVGALLVVLTLAALAAVALSTLSGTLAAPFVSLAEASSWLASHSVEPFAANGLASLRPPEYSGAAALVYIIYYVPLLLLMFEAARRLSSVNTSTARPELSEASRSRLFKPTLFASVSMALLITLHPLSAGRPDGRLRLDFLDVGQGDAALLTMPDGTTLLLDGGGRMRFRARGGGEEGVETFERDARGVGDAVVSEYLWHRGLDRVNFILPTHADTDHIEGLNDVASNFKVDAALVARAPASDEEFARFDATARRNRVPLYGIARGDLLRFGGVAIDVLWPPLAAAGAASRNDDSVVLRIRFGRRTFLLTGDIESRAESALLGARDELRCDAVKVAHHGSRTSSTEAFVNAARPTFALISVGLDSPYGHPHPNVLERWRASGAQILTTGERGTITLSTDGQDLRVETHVREGEKP
jgi:competence protein ComEC